MDYDQYTTWSENARLARMGYLDGKLTAGEFLRRIDMTHELESYETNKAELVEETVWQRILNDILRDMKWDWNPGYGGDTFTVTPAAALVVDGDVTSEDGVIWTVKKDAEEITIKADEDYVWMLGRWWKYDEEGKLRNAGLSVMASVTVIYARAAASNDWLDSLQDEGDSVTLAVELDGEKYYWIVGLDEDGLYIQPPRVTSSRILNACIAKLNGTEGVDFEVVDPGNNGDATEDASCYIQADKKLLIEITDPANAGKIVGCKVNGVTFKSAEAATAAGKASIEVDPVTWWASEDTVNKVTIDPTTVNSYTIMWDGEAVENPEAGSDGKWAVGDTVTLPEAADVSTYWISGITGTKRTTSPTQSLIRQSKLNPEM